VVVTVSDLALAAAHAHTVAVLEAGRLVTWASPACALGHAVRGSIQAGAGV
jgi:hypothetical protein